METRKHKWRDKKRALTRQMLLEAAQEVFLLRGYAATMEEMAHHARCSAGLFYTYFPSKQALLETFAMQQLTALFETAVAQMRAVDASASSLREGLGAMARHVAQRQAAFRFLLQAAPVWREQGNGATVHTPHVMQEFARLTTELLQESQRAGLVRSDVSVSELQSFVNMVCFGLIERVTTATGDPHAEELASLAWDLLCGGIQRKLAMKSGAHACHGDSTSFVAGRQTQADIPSPPEAPAAHMSPTCAHPVGTHDDRYQGQNGGSPTCSPMRPRNEGPRASSQRP